MLAPRPAGGRPPAARCIVPPQPRGKGDDMAQGRIACLLGPGFEDSEFRVPYDALKNAGYQVDIISMKAGTELKGYKGKETVKSEKGIDEVRADDYQAMLIPGGHSPDQIRKDKKIVEFVKKFDSMKRPIAAVCHGPQLLLTARLVRGRTLTAWETVQGDLDQAGANVKDQEVVVDQNWITSRKPEDLKAFSEAMLKALKQTDQARPQPRA